MMNNLKIKVAAKNCTKLSCIIILWINLISCVDVSEEPTSTSKYGILTPGEIKVVYDITEDSESVIFTGSIEALHDTHEAVVSTFFMIDFDISEENIQEFYSSGDHSNDSYPIWWLFQADKVYLTHKNASYDNYTTPLNFKDKRFNYQIKINKSIPYAMTIKSWEIELWESSMMGETADYVISRDINYSFTSTGAVP